MKRTFAFIVIIFISSQLLAQQNKPQRSMQQSVDSAEIIVEGRDIKDEAVLGTDGKVFTVHYFLPLKWFKGQQPDTVKIITAGGKVQDTVTLVSDPYEPSFGINFEYLLFCRKEDVKPYHVKTGTYFYPITGTYGVTLLGKAFKIENTRQPFFYEHLLKQNYPEKLFQPVAATVRTPYKVVRPDVTDEVKAFNEKQRQKFVSDSLQKAGAAH